MHLFHEWKREAKHLIHSIIEDGTNSTSIVWMENSKHDVNYPLIHCEDVYDVTKVIGQLKSYFGSLRKVLFRGQSKHYNFSQKPKIFRGKSNIEEIIPDVNSKVKNRFYEDYMEKLQDFTYELKKKQRRFDCRDLNFPAWEPVLQHYGIKSRYIDLVDDLNTALWFSVIGWNNDHQEFYISQCRYSYLFVYLTSCNTPISNGVFSGPDQRLINLREALPAFALRPHIQQGYLLGNHEFVSHDLYYHRSKDATTIDDITNYNQYVLCSIRIETKYLLEYLGIKRLAEDISKFKASFNNYVLPPVYSERTIFPGPEKDELFSLLLYSQYKFEKYFQDNEFEEISTAELLAKYMESDQNEREKLEDQLIEALLGTSKNKMEKLDKEIIGEYIEKSLYDLLAWSGQYQYDIGKIDSLGYDFDPENFENKFENSH